MPCAAPVGGVGAWIGKPFSEEVWEQNGRYFDPFRPAIEPGGFASPEEVIASRRTTLRAIAKAIREADVFVFTLGLTESWRNKTTDETYAICPGTVAGTFDPASHEFQNFEYPEIMEDLDYVFGLAKRENPDIRFLLTVSPVPLVASASGQHVLPATVYSKSVLRAAAGAAAARHDFVDYFPSYEIVSSAPSKGRYFEEDLRSVTKSGVKHVMSVFMQAVGGAEPEAQGAKGEAPAPVADIKPEDNLVCEEIALERGDANA